MPFDAGNLKSKFLTKIKKQLKEIGKDWYFRIEKNIENLNGKPFILLSSAGTVNTADFDDFNAITILT
jgi:hypothetical protein